MVARWAMEPEEFVREAFRAIGGPMPSDEDVRMAAEEVRLVVRRYRAWTLAAPGDRDSPAGADLMYAAFGPESDPEAGE